MVMSFQRRVGDAASQAAEPHWSKRAEPMLGLLLP